MLPFARVTLKSLIPQPYDFNPASVGDHIRKKRLQLGLFQREAAQQLGVDTMTVLNWEIGQTEPTVSAFPQIFEFLGYDPLPEPETIQDRLVAKRRKMGWSIKEAAEKVGVDPGTWGNWEQGRTKLYRQHREKIAEMLSLSFDAIDQDN